ncbi:MAG: leucine dehydrogenase [Acidobacteriota bacterium]|nr:leucine dehydrogenase [Acidobacteriota bacterium]
MPDLASMAPAEFCRFLAETGIRRFYIVRDDERGGVVASHEALAPLATLLAQDTRDFDLHEGLFVQRAPRTGVLQGAFVHRTCRGQAAGGVRYWSYPSVEKFLRDGLRLATGMTLKNALAGLWWGGGKGVMARGTGDAEPGDPERRRSAYAEYGAFMTSLGGCYVTAEDVGTTVDDMAAIFSRTRFTTCIPPEVGGSGNPSPATAVGVVRGMQAALLHLGRGGLEGKTVVIQGLGEVGQHLAEELAKEGAGRLIAADVDPGRGAEMARRFPGVSVEFRPVEPGDPSILSEKCDVLAPCATGGVLGPLTIPRVEASVVCGAANNQLEDPRRDDRLLHQRGTLYVPDFLVNRMGIVKCADEQYGVIENDARIQRHLGREWEGGIHALTLRVLAEARESGETPHRVALELAQRRSLEKHPVWGHRGLEIIRGLVASGWASGG